jgi:predicted  nucleic acid-binding Zn-ribbon protein
MKKSVEKSTVEFSKLRKQIELIGIEVKGLDEKAETGRLKLSSSINTL